MVNNKSYLAEIIIIHIFIYVVNTWRLITLRDLFTEGYDLFEILQGLHSSNYSFIILVHLLVKSVSHHMIKNKQYSAEATYKP